MLKIVLRTVLFIAIIFTISVIYLSTNGIKTSQFNGLIKNKLIELDSRLGIELEEVKLILDLSKKEIKAITNNTNLYLDNNLIELSKININIDREKANEIKKKLNKVHEMIKKHTKTHEMIKKLNKAQEMIKKLTKAQGMKKPAIKKARGCAF